MPHLHRNIRLPADHYVGQRRYFITAVCEDRHHAFTNPEIASWTLNELRKESIEYRFAIDAYCAMPDHLHLLARGLDSASNLLDFLRRFKGQTTRWYAIKTNRELWQKKFYDYILRAGDSGGSVAAYIWQNPLRRGLCTDPRQYPFSGSFTRDWQNLIAPELFWRPHGNKLKRNRPACGGRYRRNHIQNAIVSLITNSSQPPTRNPRHV